MAQWEASLCSSTVKVIGSKLRKWGTKSRLCDVIEIHGADRDKTELYQRMRHNLSASHISLPLHTHTHTLFLLVLFLIE